MSRLPVGVVLGVLVLFAAPHRADEPRPGDRPAEPREKIDATADRSLTGYVEKVEAKDEKNGTFVLRTGRDQPRYTLQVNPRTKILTGKNTPLEAGLRSPLLARAEVRVTFIDRKPPDEKKGPADLHVCRTLQIIKPGQ